MTHYDVVVLGAGPGGYVAAIRAAQLGLNTAIVEPKYWGGVCLNVGCIPSKALLRNAELAHIFHKEAKQFGISGEATFDYGVAFDRSRKVADGRVAGVHFLMKKNKITEVHGYGKFTGPNSLEVDLNEGGTETLEFDNAIIATGSSTRLVPGTSLSENVVTYEKQILSRDLPGSIIVAGAGAIGMEFAYVLKNFGVEVTIVEFLPRALPNDVSASIGLAQLERLPANQARRAEIWRHYQRELGDLDWLERPVEPAPGERHSWFTYLVRVLGGRRDRLARRLLDQGIYTTLRYHPLHMAGTFGPPVRALPGCELLAEQGLNLPLHPALSDGDVERVVTAVRAGA